MGALCLLAYNFVDWARTKSVPLSLCDLDGMYCGEYPSFTTLAWCSLSPPLLT